MKLKLQLASLFTLGILSGFVLSIVLALFYIFADLSWTLIIGIVILYNFLVWLIGPFFTDYVYKWFYKIKFYEYDEIKDKRYAKFIKKTCDKYNIKFPKIGIISDKNPTAFTYGSGKYNARIVFTEGLFHFLNEEEIDAVLAHEIGHIKNRDFIIMTIASTLLQILYEFYVIFARSKTRKKSKSSKGSGILLIIGLVSYLFYWMGTYVILFLSRTREYFADQFAAGETDPNHISSALLKIAYGIAAVPDTKDTARLLNSTRALGALDFKSAEEIGLLYKNSDGHIGKIKDSFKFDLLSPWAFLFELKSTHPLIAKRLMRLSGMSPDPLFDFKGIEKNVDKGRMWRIFFTDIFVLKSTGLFFIAFVASQIIYVMIQQSSLIVTAAISALFFISVLLRINYKFPAGFEKTDVLSCMADPYVSPVRGKPVELSGKAIGKGIPGYVFGEDMIFQDKTGFVYLNYESTIPLFGNLLFAWKKLEKLLHRDANITGWFVRGNTHHIELKKFSAAGENINSAVRFWYSFGQILGAVLLIGLMMIVSYYINTAILAL